MKKLVLALCALGAFAAATPVSAAVVNVSVTGSDGACDTLPYDTTPTATKCAGYFDGNVLNQANSDTIAASLAALGVSYTGQYADYQTITGLSGAVDLTQFGTLTGLQTIGIHFGNGGGAGALGNVTAFYQIDFGSTGSVLHLNVPASSSATLFTTAAVPEPATWAMMLLGFGAIGVSMRRRKPVLAQLA